MGSLVLLRLLRLGKRAKSSEYASNQITSLVSDGVEGLQFTISQSIVRPSRVLLPDCAVCLFLEDFFSYHPEFVGFSAKADPIHKPGEDSGSRRIVN